MVVFTYPWAILKWTGRRFRSIGGFIKNHEQTCVLLVTLLWVIWWSCYQDSKGNERLASFKGQVGRLEKSHVANNAKLSGEYAKIASDVEKNANGFTERSDELLLDEIVRRIVASHGNTERAHKDVYEKALKKGKGYYIFELNQASNGIGSGVYVTSYNLRPCKLDANGYLVPTGSSYSLTTQEKKNINEFLTPLIEKFKGENQKDEFENIRSVQKQIFKYIWENKKSCFGCITERPSFQSERPTFYSAKRDKAMMTFDKLAAIIGHIGDLLIADG